MEETSSPAPRIKIRIESLSDLVFGLALSIGTLFLVGNPPTTGGGIVFSVALFGFGFLIIVMTWLGYSRTMAVLPVEVPFALLVNLFLLFAVAIEPYLFFLDITSGTNNPSLVNPASVAYALDVGGMFMAQAALARMVVVEGERKRFLKEIHPAVHARFKQVVRIDLVVGAFFLVSSLPIFWVQLFDVPLRFYMWTISFFVFPLLRPPRGWRGEKGK